MVNKCAYVGCNSGYATCTEKRSLFSFPLNKPDLNAQWVRFVNRDEWKPTKSSVLCDLHFEDKFLLHGKKTNLKWAQNPIPTIHSKEILKRPSLVPTTVIPRKAPKLRVYQEDEMETFRDNDIITSYKDLIEKYCPLGYQYKKTDDYVIYFNLKFDDYTSFPKIFECIRGHVHIHVATLIGPGPIRF